jgi:hypothetical protein
MKISALGVEEQRVNVVLDFVDRSRAARAALGDGYRVEVRAVIWESSRVRKVPTSALFRHGGNWAVYVVEAGRARRTVIELGRQTGQSAEVTAGLADGTHVILHRGDTLADGARVRDDSSESSSRGANVMAQVPFASGPRIIATARLDRTLVHNRPFPQRRAGPRGSAGDDMRAHGGGQHHERGNAEGADHEGKLGISNCQSGQQAPETQRRCLGRCLHPGEHVRHPEHANAGQQRQGRTGDLQHA